MDNLSGESEYRSTEQVTRVVTTPGAVEHRRRQWSAARQRTVLELVATGSFATALVAIAGIVEMPHMGLMAVAIAGSAAGSYSVYKLTSES